MKSKDLTQGSIFRSLWDMAVPLISASFIQMAYSMTDMLWLGHLGSECVAAAGAAGFFVWMCNSLSFITKVGAEITVSQSVGAKDQDRAANYARQALSLSFIIGLAYSCLIFASAPFLAGLFDFEESISSQTINYLRIVAPGLFFQFNNNTFSGIYNGQGDSHTPFRTSAAGLVANIILDPILIYGLGPIPRMGTAGAAIATALSQFVVFYIFSRRVFSPRFSLGEMHVFNRLNRDTYTRILRLGFPVSIQNALFSVFSLTLATMAARWGAVGVAAQSIGAQIEAISWMTAAGFSTALAAFAGQNYGAGNYRRIRQGFRLTMGIAGGIGLSAGIIFFFFSEEIFSCFVNEPDAVKAGSDYLRILALSQLFMVTESVTAGAFNGTGNTVPPALNGILFTAARIPMAYFLSSFPAVGLCGIWWAITISSIIKGTVLPFWFSLYQKRHFPAR